MVRRTAVKGRHNGTVLLLPTIGHRVCGIGCVSALAAQPLKVMGIVDGAVRHLARAPTESGVAMRAPHKIASLNLTNADATLGARLGLFRNEARRLHFGRVARVGRIFTVETFEVQAVRTRVL